MADGKALRFHEEIDARVPHEWDCFARVAGRYTICSGFDTNDTIERTPRVNPRPIKGHRVQRGSNLSSAHHSRSGVGY